MYAILKHRSAIPIKYVALTTSQLRPTKAHKWNTPNPNAKAKAKSRVMVNSVEFRIEFRVD